MRAGDESWPGALITTKSGQEITLHLVSGGKAAASARVDFLVEYRRHQSFLVGPSERQSFLIAETRPILSATSSSPPTRPEKPDLVAQALEKQKSLSTPARPFRISQLSALVGFVTGEAEM